MRIDFFGRFFVFLYVFRVFIDYQSWHYDIRCFCWFSFADQLGYWPNDSPIIFFSRITEIIFRNLFTRESMRLFFIVFKFEIFSIIVSIWDIRLMMMIFAMKQLGIKKTIQKKDENRHVVLCLFFLLSVFNSLSIQHFIFSKLNNSSE